jgi:hypothetical protein
MLNHQTPLIRQFIQHITSKFQSTTTDNTAGYYSNSLCQSKSNAISIYSTDSFNHDDDNEECFRYAPCSIYSADSFCSKTTTSTTITTSNSVFEKTYVSFPEFTPSTTSNRALFTKPEVMTATATPMFCKTPHSKPIWIA